MDHFTPFQEIIPIIPSFLNRRASNYVGLTQINVYRKIDFMVKKNTRFARRVGLLDQFGGIHNTLTGTI